MAEFAYVAKTMTGEEQSGFLTGTTADEVVGHLHARGMVVLYVTEHKARAHGFVAGFRSFASKPIGHVGTRDIALFTRQFATVLAAGIPLVRALRGLAADTGSRTLSKAILDIATRIERGEAVSEAMAAHPEAFNSMYVSMIRAGERAGTLDDILEHLAVYLEKIDAIKTKVRSAMSYPVFVLCFAVVATLFLLLKIVPTFEKIYADFGQKLPGMTLLILNISNAIRSHAFLSLGIAVLVIVGLMLLGRTKPGRYAFDTFMIKMWIFGPIVRKAVMSRFARTFGILLKSGLPMLEGLELVRGATGNAVVSKAVADARAKIAAGQGITQAFRSTRKFPEMVLQLMATGEESGEMDSMLLKASDFYDRQVEAAVHGLTSLIEPLLVVLVGAMIGVIVVAMFLPIFYLGDTILKGGYNY
jgi:type IV pilus assembly protein PilC